MRRLGLPLAELLLEVGLRESHEHLRAVVDDLLEGLNEEIEAGNDERKSGSLLGKHWDHENFEGLEDVDDRVNLQEGRSGTQTQFRNIREKTETYHGPFVF